MNKNKKIILGIAIAIICIIGVVLGVALAGNKEAEKEKSNTVKVSGEQKTDTKKKKSATEKKESVEKKEEKPAYTYTDMDKTMYAKTEVNIRKGPEASFEKTGSLKTNDEVKVTGQCNETKWYRIIVNNETAYVNNNYLVEEKVEQTASQPANQTPAPTTPTATGTEQPVVETQPTVNPNPKPAKYTVSATWPQDGYLWRTTTFWWYLYCTDIDPDTGELTMVEYRLTCDSGKCVGALENAKAFMPPPPSLEETKQMKANGIDPRSIQHGTTVLEVCLED